MVDPKILIKKIVLSWLIISVLLVLAYSFNFISGETLCYAVLTFTVVSIASAVAAKNLKDSF